MPNPPDLSQPLFVADDDAYHQRFGELMEAAKIRAAAEGLCPDDINAAASGAAEFARNTPFALVATAMIQGDRSAAEELCRVERETNGDNAARILMERVDAAVREKLALLAESREARRYRNRDRRR